MDTSDYNLMKILINIGELAGEISFNSKDSECIRNKYGYIQRIQVVRKKFKKNEKNSSETVVKINDNGIDFKKLYHLKHILSTSETEEESVFSDSELKQGLISDVRSLQMKIADILWQENESVIEFENQINNLKSSYNPKEHKILNILKFSGQRFQQLIFKRIHEELTAFENVDLRIRHDLYYFCRKFTIIGELLHEIIEDHTIQINDELKGAFRNLSKTRTLLIHDHKQIETYTENHEEIEEPYTEENMKKLLTRLETYYKDEIEKKINKELDCQLFEELKPIRFIKTISKCEVQEIINFGEDLSEKHEYVMDHIVALIGQYMRDLDEAEKKSLQLGDNIISSRPTNSCIEASVAAKTARSSELCHDIFSLNRHSLLKSIQYSILPAKQEFLYVDQIFKYECCTYEKSSRSVQMYYRLGLCYSNLCMFNKAIIYYKQCLGGIVEDGLSRMFLVIDDYDQTYELLKPIHKHIQSIKLKDADDMCEKCFEILYSIKKAAYSLGHACVYLVTNHALETEPEKFIKYLKQGLDIIMPYKNSKNVKSNDLIALLLVNLGAKHFDLGQKYNLCDKTEEALINYDKSINYLQQIEDDSNLEFTNKLKIFDFSIDLGFKHYNLGQKYNSCDDKSKEALENYNKSINYLQQIEDDSNLEFTQKFKIYECLTSCFKTKGIIKKDPTFIQQALSYCDKVTELINAQIEQKRSKEQY
ncbi:uncharacterized protein LOC123292883 [Chrysoperla carnea]|uniref:uncharacterized protein LOC123292883 n=1 Tax=Chrysoperla carnea TaxID=189513 RepID=UPI001D079E7A|nr:uncharacterized protein LOC123292883 [Chrysoperla carnea]